MFGAFKWDYIVIKVLSIIKQLILDTICFLFDHSYPEYLEHCGEVRCDICGRWVRTKFKSDWEGN
jgi:hypothetical protein